MPSTIGHALGGIAAAWAADLVPGRRLWRLASPAASWYERAGNGLTLTCAILGIMADVDLLFRIHRTATHSLVATVFVGLFAGAMAANAGRPVLRVSLMCGAAYGTHLLLDLLAADRYVPYGIQLFWPFNRTWFISGLDLFPQTERRYLWTLPVIKQDLAAIVREVLILGPTLVALWLVRVKVFARLATEVSRRDEAIG